MSYIKQNLFNKVKDYYLSKILEKLSGCLGQEK